MLDVGFPIDTLRNENVGDVKVNHLLPRNRPNNPTKPIAALFAEMSRASHLNNATNVDFATGKFSNNDSQIAVPTTKHHIRLLINNTEILVIAWRMT
jgi:hypothetical protein